TGHLNITGTGIFNSVSGDGSALTNLSGWNLQAATVPDSALVSTFLTNVSSNGFSFSGDGTSGSPLSLNFAGTGGHARTDVPPARADHLHDGAYLSLNGGSLSGDLFGQKAQFFGPNPGDYGILAYGGSDPAGQGGTGLQGTGGDSGTLGGVGVSAGGGNCTV